MADSPDHSFKSTLRTELLSRRGSRSAQLRDDLGRSLAVVALGQPRLAAAGCVCGYVGVGTEPHTGPLLAGLLAGGAEVLLPILAPDRMLDWGRYSGPDALVPGPFGLLEPAGVRLGCDAAAAAAVLLVPALAVDQHGRRLGRGGGYYDRLLARLATAATGAPPAWAVVYDEVLERVPAEPHDIPVSAALTPSAFRPVRPVGSH